MRLVPRETLQCLAVREVERFLRLQELQRFKSRVHDRLQLLLRQHTVHLQ
jgi:hypothetical protein